MLSKFAGKGLPWSENKLVDVEVDLSVTALECVVVERERSGHLVVAFSELLCRRNNELP